MNSASLFPALVLVLLGPSEPRSEAIVAECSWGGPHGFNLRILRADAEALRGELSETTIADHVPRGAFPHLRYSSNEGSATYGGAGGFRLEIDRRRHENGIFEGTLTLPGAGAVAVRCHQRGGPGGRALVVRLLPDPGGQDRAGDLAEETFAELGRQASKGTLGRLLAHAEGKTLHVCAEYGSDTEAEAALAVFGEVVVRGAYSRRATLASACGSPMAPQ